MSPTTSHDLRCPTCAAHVRADADWCTLCYTDLRPPVEAPQETVVEATAAEPVEVVGGRGKHARQSTSYDDPAAGAREAQAADPRELPEEAALGVEAMFAVLAAQSTPPLGPLARYLDSTGSRTAVMVGGLAAVTVLGFALMALLGSLL